MRAAIILVIFIALAFIACPTPLPAIDGDRFFRVGDGRIHIKNSHNNKEAKVSLLNADNSVNEKALDAVDAVFGFSPARPGEHISLRLIFLLDYFSDLIAPGRTIRLISGYRSPEYNEKLRNSGGNVAPTSTHMDGIALDFYIDGVDGMKLWERIRRENCCGVGHYGGRSVHLDTARPRFWQAATSKTSSGESDYNRRIYLSTEFDRYRPGEKLRLSLTSVSDFGFGVAREISILPEDGSNPAPSVAILQTDEQCMLVSDRDGSRSIYATLPDNLKPGRYRIRIDFCRIPSPQMPPAVASNIIEVREKIQR